MRGITILWGKDNIFQKKNNLLYIYIFFFLKKAKPFTGWPATPYMEPGVVEPPPEHLAVDPRGVLKVV